MVQEAANSIPFSNKYPQLGSVSPTSVAPGTGALPFTALGNFVDASREGYLPTLQVGSGKPISASTNYRGSLQFLVDVSGFPHGAGLLYPTITIKIPYRKCTLFFFACKHIAEFDTLVTSLPPSPGSLTYDTDYVTTGIERNETTSPNQHLDARNGDQKGVCLHVGPSPGWTYIDPSTVRPINGVASGDQHLDGSCSNDSNAGWIATVIQHHFPNCCDGYIDFQLDYVQWRNTIVHNPSSIQVPLNWNESLLETFNPTGTWHAVFHQFDGRDIPIVSVWSSPLVSLQA